jgi:hypothetical protein
MARFVRPLLFLCATLLMAATVNHVAAADPKPDAEKPPAAATPSTAAKPSALGERRASWRTQTVKPDRPELVEYCLTEADFTNGASLGIARSYDGQESLIVGFPGAILWVGDGYATQVAVDDNFRRSYQGRAATGEILIVETPAKDKLLDTLRRGRELTVRVGGAVSRFSLEGSAVAFQQLLECSGGAVASPLGADAAGAKPPSALEDILKAAGIGPVKVAAVAEGQGRERLDFFWEHRRVLGGVKELPRLRDVPFGEQVKAEMTAIKQLCTGTLKDSLEPQAGVGRASFAKALIRCEEKEGATVAALYFIGTESALTLFYFQAQAVESIEASAQRDAVAEVVQLLAQPKPASEATRPAVSPPAAAR